MPRGEQPEWVFPVLGASGILFLGLLFLACFRWFPVRQVLDGPEKPIDAILLLVLYTLMAGAAWVLAAVASRWSRWGLCLLLAETPFLLTLPWVWVAVLRALSALD